MKVTIAGPNLRDQSKGSFHVHAAGCADIAKAAARDPEFRPGRAWTFDVVDRLEVSEAVYGDIIEENGDTPANYLGDFYFAPCCDALVVDDSAR